MLFKSIEPLAKVELAKPPLFRVLQDGVRSIN
jgi:hypothetical protein